MIEDVMVTFDFVCPECGQVIRMKVPFEEYERWTNYDDVDELDSMTDEEREILNLEICSDCIERHKEEDFPESIEISFENVVLTKEDLIQMYKDDNRGIKNPKDWIKHCFTNQDGYYDCWDIIEDGMDIKTIKINK